jgi:3-oxoadipate enol-lactonase
MIATTGQQLVAPLGDLKVAYSRVGGGEPVVLVHGLAETREAWVPQLRTPGKWRLLAYDVRGHGQSALGSAEGTLEQLGGDLTRFLERISGPATCVGFSLGGTVVLWAAAAQPELVRRAIVLGTSSVVGSTAATFYRQRIDLARSGDRRALRAALREDTRAGLARAGADLEALTDWRLAAIGDGAGYINAATAMARLHERPLTGMLERVRCRVEVIGGEHDRFCPHKAAEILLSSLPDARYHELAGVGHLMNVDDPAGVTATLHALLDEEEAG